MRSTWLYRIMPMQMLCNGLLCWSHNTSDGAKATAIYIDNIVWNCRKGRSCDIKIIWQIQPLIAVFGYCWTVALFVSYGILLCIFQVHELWINRYKTPLDFESVSGTGATTQICNLITWRVYATWHARNESVLRIRNCRSTARFGNLKYISSEWVNAYVNLPYLICIKCRLGLSHPVTFLNFGISSGTWCHGMSFGWCTTLAISHPDDSPPRAMSPGCRGILKLHRTRREFGVSSYVIRVDNVP